MSINCIVTPGYIYGANYTVDFGDLNQLGNPAVAVPDGGSLAFGAGSSAAPTIRFGADTAAGLYRPAANIVGVAGGLGLASGTVAAPAVAFVSDTDTGLYLAGANTIGIAGALGLADGTAATPGMAFANDTNTGIARTAADTMVAACGGTAVATFSATGIDAIGLRVNGVGVALAGIDKTTALLVDDFAIDSLADSALLAFSTGTTSCPINGIIGNTSGDRSFGSISPTAGAANSSITVRARNTGRTFRADCLPVFRFRIGVMGVMAGGTIRIGIMNCGLADGTERSALNAYFQYAPGASENIQLFVDDTLVKTTSVPGVTGMQAHVLEIAQTATGIEFRRAGSLLFSYARTNSFEAWGFYAYAARDASGTAAYQFIDWYSVTAPFVRTWSP